MKGNVLLIEDEKLMRITLEDSLKSDGYDVMSFDTGTEALKALKNYSFEIAVTDVRLPDIDGFYILREIARFVQSQVIVMTAFGTIKDAVEAMKSGAFDYITKPFALDEFLLLIERALDVKRLRKENIWLGRDCFPHRRERDRQGACRHHHPFRADAKTGRWKKSITPRYPRGSLALCCVEHYGFRRSPEK